jgi:hypothetical protein
VPHTGQYGVVRSTPRRIARKKVARQMISLASGPPFSFILSRHWGSLRPFA